MTSVTRPTTSGEGRPSARRPEAVAGKSYSKSSSGLSSNVRSGSSSRSKGSNSRPDHKASSTDNNPRSHQVTTSKSRVGVAPSQPKKTAAGTSVARSGTSSTRGRPSRSGTSKTAKAHESWVPSGSSQSFRHAPPPPPPQPREKEKKTTVPSAPTEPSNQFEHKPSSDSLPAQRSPPMTQPEVGDPSTRAPYNSTHNKQPGVLGSINSSADAMENIGRNAARTGSSPKNSRSSRTSRGFIASLRERGRKSIRGSVRQSQQRSSSADDALAAAAAVAYEPPLYPPGTQHPRLSKRLAAEVRKTFAPDASTALLGCLAEHELWNAAAIRNASQGQRSELILSCAVRGFKTLQLAKLRDWLRIKVENKESVDDDDEASSTEGVGDKTDEFLTAKTPTRSLSSASPSSSSQEQIEHLKRDIDEQGQPPLSSGVDRGRSRQNRATASLDDVVASASRDGPLPFQQFALDEDGRGNYRASSLEDVTLASNLLGASSTRVSGGSHHHSSNHLSLRQTVHSKFRAVQCVDQVMALLQEANVHCEDGLVLAGDQVFEAAKQGHGNLSLKQLNLLEDWVESVKADAQEAQWREQYRRANRHKYHKSSSNANATAAAATSCDDLLFDPWRAAQEEAALQAVVGDAVGEAIRNSGRGTRGSSGNDSRSSDAQAFDPERRERAKSKAALAMYQLSMKKRHYKGLRPSTDILVPPTYWNSGRSRSTGANEFELLENNPGSSF